MLTDWQTVNNQTPTRNDMVSLVKHVYGANITPTTKDESELIERWQELF
jgi:hypothetical protein